MKPALTALLLVVLTASIVAQVSDPAVAGDPPPMAPLVLAVSPKVVVGETVTVLMIPHREGAVARLTDPHGAVACDAPGFVAGAHAGIVIQAFLLGVGSAGTLGEYRLEMVIGDAVVADRPIEVEGREFRYEDIPLDASLTDLRANWNPEKDREARELLTLFASVDTTSVYHLAPFLWPVEQWRITSWFGDRRTYLYSDGESANSIHVGIDLGAPEGATPGTYVGEPVFASGAGKVAFAAPRIVTGNSVVLEHLPGLFSVYFHLDTMAVSAGDEVAVGQLIGTVGMTGLATGPHLHWEFRVRGIPVEPETMVLRRVLDIRPPFSTITAPGEPDGNVGATERR